MKAYFEPGVTPVVVSGDFLPGIVKRQEFYVFVEMIGIESVLAFQPGFDDSKHPIS
jgi:hypothetical protein